jgi:hypothetical protein
LDHLRPLNYFTLPQYLNPCVYPAHMSYSPDQVSNLLIEHKAVLSGLQSLLLECVVQDHSIAEPRVQEHLLHGAGRRVKLLERTLQNVFEVFPPSTERPLAEEARADVQINLQAFVMNLYGIFDNWAWAFVLRHNLESQISHYNVGLFNDKTKKHLPEPIKSYLNSPNIIRWYKEYLKNYRDALAHRIPPYIPPAVFTVEEDERYKKLENEEVECIKSREWERLDQIREEQAAIGKSCLTFLHSFSGSGEESPRPMLLHPQLLCDAKVVVEFGGLYFQHWDERA